jgi:hypothetical protein
MIFYCDKCGKEFNYKSCLKSHQNKKVPCTEKPDSFTCEICNKTYTNRASYRKHKSRGCKQIKESCNDKDFDISSITKLLTENKELSTKVYELENKIRIQQKETQTTKTNNSTNHSHNQSHNTQTNSHNNTLTNANNTNLIQYVTMNFPNAKNIEDCINIKNITQKLLQDCYNMYFLEGSMHIIKQMCDIGEEYRPFHCTDASRGNYIYKTNDMWKIDVGGEEIKTHIIPVINSTYRDVHSKRITDNPTSSETIANMCFEMTHDNIRKVCGKAFKKVTTSFVAKNMKNVGTNSLVKNI